MASARDSGTSKLWYLYSSQWLKTIQISLYYTCTVESNCPTTTIPYNDIEVGHHRLASETPFEWRFAGGPMVDRHSMLTGIIIEALERGSQVFRKPLNILKNIAYPSRNGQISQKFAPPQKALFNRKFHISQISHRVKNWYQTSLAENVKFAYGQFR